MLSLIRIGALSDESQTLAAMSAKSIIAKVKCAVVAAAVVLPCLPEAAPRARGARLPGDRVPPVAERNGGKFARI